jgi:hypothetical protein
MATINFKTTDQMSQSELTIAYLLYFFIAIVISLAIYLVGWDAPRGLYIAFWGLPIGVVVMWLFKKEMVQTRHIGREFIIGMIGFIAYGVYMIALDTFSIFTIWDFYYYFIGATIIQVGLVFFYALYLATDNLEQKGYHLLAVPLASFVIIIATYVAIYLTRVYI